MKLILPRYSFLMILAFFMQIQSCTLFQHSVTITTKEGGNYYLELVKDAKFAGQELPSEGIFTVTNVSGKNTLSWVSYNTNGFGMVLSPVNHVKVIDVAYDMEITIEGSKYIVH